jgi:hypothetical protein
MKISMLLTLVVVIGCVLATGCIAQTKKDLNNTTVNTTNTFTPFVNTTMNSTNSTNVTNATNVTPLRGPLRVSISNFKANLVVILDNQTIGSVTTAKPLDVMVNEGNHSVKVCVGVICEEENVTIAFAKKSFIDFGERLKKDVEFPEPTARITDSYRDGDSVAVVVEFINPSIDNLRMNAEIAVGYSFISGRTGQRVGESARGVAYSDVSAGRRQSEVLHLYFAEGTSYNYDPPALQNIKFTKIL